VIPKARGVRKTLFCVSTPKETKDTGVCLLCVGQSFFSSFCFALVVGINMEEKTYSTMDLPVYGEADGANFISVED